MAPWEDTSSGRAVVPAPNMEFELLSNNPPLLPLHRLMDDIRRGRLVIVPFPTGYAFLEPNNQAIAPGMMMELSGGDRFTFA